MHRAILSVLLAVPLITMPLVVTPSALATPFVIVGDTRIGDFRTGQGAQIPPAGTLPAAIKAFGQPSTRRDPHDPSNCNVTWKSIGVTALFYNLAGADPCKRSGFSGFFLKATMTDRRWQTDKGLRIGDSVARLRRIYPRSRQSGADWILSTSGTGIYTSSSVATSSNGRVRSFTVAYPAGGD